MKVTVSVFGRFHAFYLARELSRRGHLRRLITSYPKFEVSEYGLPREKVTSLVTHEVLHRAWNRWIPSKLKPDVDPRALFADRFDRAAARQIPSDTEIYVGWSSKAEQGIERAREIGAVTVVERGSTHIEEQRDLLAGEYRRFGLTPRLPHPEIVEKEKREYAAADYISVPSKYVKRSFLRKGFPERKLIHVPYGVDLDGFHPVEKGDTTFRVIFAGGITLQKGVHYLLQAFAELELPGAELWLLGSKQPEIEPFFRKYQGTFTHLGHKPQDQLNWYYSQGSVFAICSIQEGMAMVQAQAMACGLPLICTTNTGGEDLIKDGEEGFVLPIRDVGALKKAILWCYEHREECREMGRAARRRVQSGFSWYDYGDRIVEAYRSARIARSS